jgi:hypothetical protein
MASQDTERRHQPTPRHDIARSLLVAGVDRGCGK